MITTPSIKLYEGPSITVVTPTILSDHLDQCIKSVANQTLDKKHYRHLVVIDGPVDNIKLAELKNRMPDNDYNVSFMQLPWNTGAGGFNGHRIYGATSYLINTPYVCWLDEDNWLEPNHLETMYKALTTGNQYDWAYCKRNIYDSENKFVCRDDCESLGFEPSFMNKEDHLIDVSCYCIKTDLAWQLSNLWYRRAREPNMMEVDRAICQVLIKLDEQNKFVGVCTNEYTLNYRTGNRSDSVMPEFFLQGNKVKKEIKTT